MTTIHSICMLISFQGKFQSPALFIAEPLLSIFFDGEKGKSSILIWACRKRLLNQMKCTTKSFRNSRKLTTQFINIQIHNVWFIIKIACVVVVVPESQRSLCSVGFALCWWNLLLYSMVFLTRLSCHSKNHYYSSNSRRNNNNNNKPNWKANKIINCQLIPKQLLSVWFFYCYYFYNFI